MAAAAEAARVGRRHNDVEAAGVYHSRELEPRATSPTGSAGAAAATPFAATPVGHLPPPTRPGLSNTLWTPTKALCALMAAAALWSGLRTSMPVMLGTGLRHPLAPGDGVAGPAFRQVTAGCVVASRETAVDGLETATRQLAAAGAELVVWSEAAVVIRDDVAGGSEAAAAAAGSEDGEPVLRDFVGRAGRLAAELNVTLVATALHRPAAGGRMRSLAFVLTPSDGGGGSDDDAEAVVAARAQKRHVFPFAESGQSAGPAAVEVAGGAGLPLGAGLAVVFGSDTTFPAYILRSAWGGADLLVEVSSDWGFIGQLRADDYTPTLAVATGLTVFRCASGGPSAVVGAHGE
ncbi:hypothetical protein HK405_000623, partial [Cladochytrium tenue]